MGGGMLDVAESPDEVQNLLTIKANGRPIQMNADHGGQTYVNPLAVAYWHVTPPPGSSRAWGSRGITGISRSATRIDRSTGLGLGSRKAWTW